jgi:REP element-mobilizing transposase RayT
MLRPPRRDGMSLPLCGNPSSRGRTHSRIIIAHHLVLTLYGHWLSNDLRGSGSIETRKSELDELGPVHHGRKKIQPSKKDIKAFYAKANPLLAHPVFWIDPAKRQAIADAFARAIADFGYTVWACAILRNHAHLLVRRHRDDGRTMWDTFAGYAQERLRSFSDVGPEHPVWSDRPYVVFVYDPPGVEGRVDYIKKNPEKEGLPPQHFAFVEPYDGWPL